MTATEPAPDGGARPVVVCLSTTLMRLAHLGPTLNSLKRQRPKLPDRIVVTPDARLVPLHNYTWAEERWKGTAVFQRLLDSFGPADKVAGCLQYAEQSGLPGEALLVITDDDYIRGPNWLDKLVSGVPVGQAAVLVSYEMMPFNGTMRVRGCNGYAASRASFGRAREFLTFMAAVADACRWVDDISVVGYMRGPRGCTVLTPALDRTQFNTVKGRHVNLPGALLGGASGHAKNIRQRMQRNCSRALRARDDRVPDILLLDSRT